MLGLALLADGPEELEPLLQGFVDFARGSLRFGSSDVGLKLIVRNYDIPRGEILFESRYS